MQSLPESDAAEGKGAFLRVSPEFRDCDIPDPAEGASKVRREETGNRTEKGAAMTAWVYAGQGSQHAGMGRDLYEAFPEARRVYDNAKLSFDLKEVSFTDQGGKINETRYTQPVMVSFAVAVTDILKAHGLKPEFVLGLSLGEYSALYAADVLSASEVIKAVAFRGEQMQNASAGIDTAMSAVLGLGEEKLECCCKEAGGPDVVSVCNYNCPGQLVIGGERKAVEEAGKLALAAGARRVIPLKVSGPFHTGFMKPAGDALREFFRHLSFREESCPVLFNYLGDLRNGQTIPELLEQQVQKPVRMESSLRVLLRQGVRDFVEIGPGKTISGFLKKTARDMGIEDIRIVSLETKEEIQGYLERYGEKHS